MDTPKRLSRLWRVWLCSLLAAVTAAPGSAAPVIYNASGTLSHGSTMTVTGLRFRSKSPTAPYLWDNMENGQFSQSWVNTNDLNVSVDAPRSSRSRYNAHLNFTSTNNDGWFQASSTVAQKWFVQYWFMVDDNWDWGTGTFLGTNRFLSNIKIFRLWSPDSINENFVVAYRGWENRFIYNMENTPDAVTTPFVSSAPDLIRKGEWHLFQFEFKENSALGAADGIFRAWFDGSLRTTVRTDIVTRQLFSQLKRPVIVGWSEVWNANTPLGDTDKAPNDFYMDDVYVDNSWSRIEIGNGPTYDSCTHREIQIPVSWSDSSVVFQVNLGSFADGDAKYLYVKDSDGAVNSQGWVLEAGSSPGGGPAPAVEEVLRPDRKFFSPSVSSGSAITFGPDAVRVEIHDVNGRLVRQLARDSADIAWDGRDLSGRLVESGVYMCVIEGASGTEIRSAIAVVK